MNEWILSSSLLIAAVLAVRFLLRGKISLRLQYALWAVVLVRLLLPVQLFTSSFGAGSIAKEVDIAEPVRQVYASANEERYEQEYDEAYRQVVADYEAMQQRFDQSYDPIVVEKTAQDMVRADLELDLKALLYQVWFAGMAAMAAVICACNLHLSLRLKRRRYEYPAADSLLSVYVTEAVPTPCIFGLFRPAVYLTPDAAKDEQVRAHVLAHELTHYRHGDHIWSVLRSVCLVLHWYNPLVWAAAKVSRADAELACDEGALARLGESQ
ncbi:MAG: M56 family metallopeptidase, partial [Oscillospiraceae bacterium]|nr:M56 family metallopeptidase [Oscillospiraceae bacterium]